MPRGSWYHIYSISFKYIDCTVFVEGTSELFDSLWIKSNQKLKINRLQRIFFKVVRFVVFLVCFVLNIGNDNRHVGKDTFVVKATNTDISSNPNILFLPLEQISKILQLGRSTTYELVNNEHCPFIVRHIGNTIRIDKASLLESLKKPITVKIWTILNVLKIGFIFMCNLAQLISHYSVRTFNI